MSSRWIVVLCLIFIWGGGEIMVGHAQSSPEILKIVPVPSKIEFSNIDKVVENAEIVKEYLKPGDVWVTKTPAGEVLIKGALIYQDNVVGVVEFNPVDGQILPQGYHPRYVTELKVPLDEIRQRLNQLISQFKIVKAVEYRERESCWEVPLMYNNMIVSHIRIYYDGVHVLPDYPASEEMRSYSASHRESN